MTAPTVDVRAITIGVTPGAPDLERRAGALFAAIEADVRARGGAVRTRRLVLPPLNRGPRPGRASAAAVARWAEELAEKLGARWFCLPFACFGDDDPRERYGLAREVLRRHRRAFVNLIVADEQGIDPRAVEGAAAAVHEVSRASANGFDNFRMGLSANCPPGTPFFPYARHERALGDLSVSLALETTNLVRAAIPDDDAVLDLGAVRERLRELLVPELRALDGLAAERAGELGATYLGVDASLAPFPDQRASVADLVERLCGDGVGAGGAVFVTSLLTNTLKAAMAEAEATTTGFNGVMYSVLEDDGLARAGAARELSLDRLLSLSAVCGCGIDMVPLPGDTLPEEIAALALDVAALSTALRKPLGCRVLPIPGRAANEMTAFNYDFLVDTRVLPVRHRARGVGGLGASAFRYLPLAPASAQRPGRAERIRAFWEARGERAAELGPASVGNLEGDASRLDEKVRLEVEAVMPWMALERDSRVLDLGAGVGHWAHRFAPLCRSVTAVEYAESMYRGGLAAARRLGLENVRWVRAAAQSWRGEGGAFERVFVSGLLIYLDDEELAALVEGVAHHLAEGGRVVVRDGTGVGARHVIDDRWSEELGARYSATYRTAEEYAAAFARAGFRLVRERDVFPEGHRLNRFAETRLRLYEWVAGAGAEVADGRG